MCWLCIILTSLLYFLFASTVYMTLVFTGDVVGVYISHKEYGYNPHGITVRYTLYLVISSIFFDIYLLSDKMSNDWTSTACRAKALMDWLLINPWCGHNTCSEITW